MVLNGRRGPFQQFTTEHVRARAISKYWKVQQGEKKQKAAKCGAKNTVNNNHMYKSKAMEALLCGFNLKGNSSAWKVAMLLALISKSDCFWFSLYLLVFILMATGSALLH